MIVRRLVMTDAKVIGFLPAIDRGAGALPELLTEWAAMMINFVPGPVGVVAEWSTWNGAAGGAVVPDGQRSRLFSLVPPSCPEAGTATPALQEALAIRRNEFARLLVNLSHYAEPPHLPTAAEFVDGVVLVIPAGRIRRTRLKQMVRDLDYRKSLGAILVD